MNIRKRESAWKQTMQHLEYDFFKYPDQLHNIFPWVSISIKSNKEGFLSTPELNHCYI